MSLICQPTSEDMKQYNSSRLDPTAFIRFVQEVTLTNPPRKKTETKREKRKTKRALIIIARTEKLAVVMDLGTKGYVYRNNLF